MLFRTAKLALGQATSRNALSGDEGVAEQASNREDDSHSQPLHQRSQRLITEHARYLSTRPLQTR